MPLIFFNFLIIWLFFSLGSSQRSAGVFSYGMTMKLAVKISQHDKALMVMEGKCCLMMSLLSQNMVFYSFILYVCVSQNIFPFASLHAEQPLLRNGRVLRVK